MARAFVQWLGQQVFDYALGAEMDEEMNEEEETIDLQCGRTLFQDVPARMRTELWMSQLHANPSALRAAHNYEAYLRLPLSESTRAEIAKDLHRTFPGNPRFASREGQAALGGVLCAYAASDEAVGYTQGMNFLAGMVLMAMGDPAASFGVLWLVMRIRGLRALYLPDMVALQGALWKLGELLPKGLRAHLESCGALPVLYASSWLLTCFAADFPARFASRVLDLVVCGSYREPVLRAALGLVVAAGPLLSEMDDLEMIVDHLRRDLPRWPPEDLRDLLTATLERPWTPQQLRRLGHTGVGETVEQAVRRVQSGRIERERDDGEARRRGSDEGARFAPGDREGGRFAPGDHAGGRPTPGDRVGGRPTRGGTGEGRGEAEGTQSDLGGVSLATSPSSTALALPPGTSPPRAFAHPPSAPAASPPSFASATSDLQRSAAAAAVALELGSSPPHPSSSAVAAAAPAIAHPASAVSRGPGRPAHAGFASLPMAPEEPPPLPAAAEPLLVEPAAEPWDMRLIDAADHASEATLSPSFVDSSLVHALARRGPGHAPGVGVGVDALLGGTGALEGLADLVPIPPVPPLADVVPITSLPPLAEAPRSGATLLSSSAASSPGRRPHSASPLASASAHLLSSSSSPRLSSSLLLLSSSPLGASPFSAAATATAAAGSPGASPRGAGAAAGTRLLSADSTSAASSSPSYAKGPLSMGAVMAGGAAGHAHGRAAAHPFAGLGSASASAGAHAPAHFGTFSGASRHAKPPSWRLPVNDFEGLGEKEEYARRGGAPPRGASRSAASLAEVAAGGGGNVPGRTAAGGTQSSAVSPTSRAASAATFSAAAPPLFFAPSSEASLPARLPSPAASLPARLPSPAASLPARLPSPAASLPAQLPSTVASTRPRPLAAATPSADSAPAAVRARASDTESSDDESLQWTSATVASHEASTQAAAPPPMRSAVGRPSASFSAGHAASRQSSIAPLASASSRGGAESLVSAGPLIGAALRPVGPGGGPSAAARSDASFSTSDWDRDDSRRFGSFITAVSDGAKPHAHDGGDAVAAALARPSAGASAAPALAHPATGALAAGASSFAPPLSVDAASTPPAPLRRLAGSDASPSLLDLSSPHSPALIEVTSPSFRGSVGPHGSVPAPPSSRAFALASHRDRGGAGAGFDRGGGGARVPPSPPPSGVIAPDNPSIPPGALATFDPATSPASALAFHVSYPTVLYPTPYADVPGVPAPPPPPRSSADFLGGIDAPPLPLASGAGAGGRGGLDAASNAARVDELWMADTQAAREASRAALVRLAQLRGRRASVGGSRDFGQAAAEALAGGAASARGSGAGIGVGGGAASARGAGARAAGASPVRGPGGPLATLARTSAGRVVGPVGSFSKDASSRAWLDALFEEDKPEETPGPGTLKADGRLGGPAIGTVLGQGPSLRAAAAATTAGPTPSATLAALPVCSTHSLDAAASTLPSFHPSLSASGSLSSAFVSATSALPGEAPGSLSTAASRLPSSVSAAGSRLPSFASAAGPRLPSFASTAGARLPSFVSTAADSRQPSGTSSATLRGESSPVGFAVSPLPRAATPLALLPPPSSASAASPPPPTGGSPPPAALEAGGSLSTLSSSSFATPRSATAPSGTSFVSCASDRAGRGLEEPTGCCASPRLEGGVGADVPGRGGLPAVVAASEGSPRVVDSPRAHPEARSPSSPGASPRLRRGLARPPGVDVADSDAARRSSSLSPAGAKKDAHVSFALPDEDSCAGAGDTANGARGSRLAPAVGVVGAEAAPPPPRREPSAESDWGDEEAGGGWRSAGDGAARTRAVGGSLAASTRARPGPRSRPAVDLEPLPSSSAQTSAAPASPTPVAGLSTTSLRSGAASSPHLPARMSHSISLSELPGSGDLSAFAAAAIEPPSAPDARGFGGARAPSARVSADGRSSLSGRIGIDGRSISERAGSDAERASSRALSDRSDEEEVSISDVEFESFQTPARQTSPGADDPTAPAGVDPDLGAWSAPGGPRRRPAASAASLPSGGTAAPRLSGAVSAPKSASSLASLSCGRPFAALSPSRAASSSDDFDDARSDGVLCSAFAAASRRPLPSDLAPPPPPRSGVRPARAARSALVSAVSAPSADVGVRFEEFDTPFEASSHSAFARAAADARSAQSSPGASRAPSMALGGRAASAASTALGGSFASTVGSRAASLARLSARDSSFGPWMSAASSLADPQAVSRALGGLQRAQGAEAAPDLPAAAPGTRPGSEEADRAVDVDAPRHPTASRPCIPLLPQDVAAHPPSGGASPAVALPPPGGASPAVALAPSGIPSPVVALAGHQGLGRPPIARRATAGVPGRSAEASPDRVAVERTSAASAARNASVLRRRPSVASMLQAAAATGPDADGVLPSAFGASAATPSVSFAVEDGGEADADVGWGVRAQTAAANSRLSPASSLAGTLSRATSVGACISRAPSMGMSLSRATSTGLSLSRATSAALSTISARSGAGGTGSGSSAGLVSGSAIANAINAAMPQGMGPSMVRAGRTASGSDAGDEEGARAAAGGGGWPLLDRRSSDATAPAVDAAVASRVASPATGGSATASPAPSSAASPSPSPVTSPSPSVSMPSGQGLRPAFSSGVSLGSLAAEALVESQAHLQQHARSSSNVPLHSNFVAANAAKGHPAGAGACSPTLPGVGSRDAAAGSAPVASPATGLSPSPTPSPPCLRVGGDASTPTASSPSGATSASAATPRLGSGSAPGVAASAFASSSAASGSASGSSFSQSPPSLSAFAASASSAARPRALSRPAAGVMRVGHSREGTRSVSPQLSGALSPSAGVGSGSLAGLPARSPLGSPRASAIRGSAASGAGASSRQHSVAFADAAGTASGFAAPGSPAAGGGLRSALRRTASAKAAEVAAWSSADRFLEDFKAPPSYGKRDKRS